MTEKYYDESFADDPAEHLDRLNYAEPYEADETADGPELDEDFDLDEVDDESDLIDDEGQPSEYEEWQDYMGGDDQFVHDDSEF